MKYELKINRNAKCYKIKDIPDGVFFYHRHNVMSWPFPDSLNLYMKFGNNLIAFYQNEAIGIEDCKHWNEEEDWIILDNAKITVEINPNF